MPRARRPGGTGAPTPCIRAGRDAPLWGCGRRTTSGNRCHGTVFGAQPRPAGPRRAAGGRGNPPRQRPAELHARRPRRHRGERGARAGALGDRHRRAGFPSQPAHHRQPGAGGSAQGLGPFRPADRAGHPGRRRASRRQPPRRLGVRRRTVARRRAAAGAGRAGHGAGAAPRRRPPRAAARQRRGGRARAGRGGVPRAPPARRGGALPARGRRRAPA